MCARCVILRHLVLRELTARLRIAVHEAIFGDVATAEDPYARLFAETALPALRSAVVNQWNPREPEPLLRCLEAYDHVLPPAARVALLVRFSCPLQVWPFI